MIKHFKNYLFLLLLVYNNLIAVQTQYKSLLHPTNNLLSPEYQQDKFDSTLASRLRKVDLNQLYKQLINKALLNTANHAGNQKNQHNKSKEDVHIVESISARDYQHNINKRQDDAKSKNDPERDIPIERRRVRKLKADPIERPDTSTDSNRDDAYYVTNIESTNINKPDHPIRMNRRVDSIIGIAKKFDTGGANSLEQIGSTEDAKVEMVNKYTSYNRLEEGVDNVDNDEYGNKYNEMELNTNGTKEGSKESNSGSKENNGQASEESQGHAKVENGETDKGGKLNKVQNGSKEDIPKTSEAIKNNTSSETVSSESFKKLFPTNTTPSGNFFSRKKELLRNIVLKRCHNRYSFLCLKIDLMKIIDKLNTTDQFTLLPGK